MRVFEMLECEKTPGDVGIEIEVEGENLKAVLNNTWVTHNDGSLRGEYPNQAAEFVLAKPIPINKVYSSVASLIRSLGPKAEFQFSERTSVHVHVNVLEMEWDKLLNFIYTYMILETVLYQFHNPSRMGNRFCLRVVDAEGIIDLVGSLIKYEKDAQHEINQGNAKYAGINLSSIFRFGSLEFRGMDGNIDPNRISLWCSILLNIRDWANKQESVLSICDLFTGISDNDLEKVLKDILGDAADKLPPVGEIYNAIALNVCLTSDIPHFYYPQRRKVHEERALDPFFKDEMEFELAQRFMDAARVADGF